CHGRLRKGLRRAMAAFAKDYGVPWMGSGVRCSGVFIGAKVHALSRRRGAPPSSFLYAFTDRFGLQGWVSPPLVVAPQGGKT
ncbi:MAG TPA: hypothetical protein PKE55_10615, partial [Kiritimatiellia bacterium]|nr:hypothetical protein [Kiritimatiellia bacterium]